MRLFSFLSPSKDRNMPQTNPMTVDLGPFQVDAIPLGSPFPTASAKAGVFQPKGQGVEIGCEEGNLDYGYFTLAEFKGSFTLNGQQLTLSNATSEDEILGLFGRPYWTDRSDGETILFYEYQAGTIELQFEFPDGTGLGFVTLCRNGVLSDPESRSGYGVNKPWPPL